MRLVIVRSYVEPTAPWRRIGTLHGGIVELHVEGDTAYVRIDDYVRFSGGEHLLEQLSAIVEEHTGEPVTETGPPILS